MGLGFEFGPQRIRDLAILCPQSVILVKKVEVCFDLVKIRMPLLKYARTMMVELATEMMRRTMSKERKTTLFIFSLNTYFQITKRFYYHIHIFIYFSLHIPLVSWQNYGTYLLLSNKRAFEKNNPISDYSFIMACSFIRNLLSIYNVQ